MKCHTLSDMRNKKLFKLDENQLAKIFKKGRGEAKLPFL
jgi:chromatin remodeling complex protein RSC6